MSTIFIVGDTVRLKSGGAMICIRKLRGDDDDHAECIWHEGQRPHREIYPMAALLPAPLAET